MGCLSGWPHLLGPCLASPLGRTPVRDMGAKLRLLGIMELSSLNQVFYFSGA